MQVHQKVQQQLEASWKTQKLAFDKRSRTKVVHVGDIIYYTRPHSGSQFQKFQPLFQGPATVLKVFPNNVIKVLKENGQSITLHVDRVKLAPFGEQLRIEPAPSCPSPPPLESPLSTPSIPLEGPDTLSPPRPPSPHVTFNPRVTVVRPSSGQTPEPPVRTRSQVQQAGIVLQSLFPFGRRAQSQTSSSDTDLPMPTSPPLSPDN